MLSIVTVFAACWLTTCIAPNTPIGRALRDWTVARPAARLARITRGHVMLMLLIAGGTATIGWALGHESVRVIAMAAPDVIAWATMFEVSAYLDALAAITLAASGARIGGIVAWLRAPFRSRRTTYVRRRRTARVHRPVAANDDDEDARADAA